MSMHANNLQISKTDKSSLGFTLVELLIAISIIGVLSWLLLSVLNPKGMQAKARDAQRVADLAKIKVALESYFADNRHYPYGPEFSSEYISANKLAKYLVPDYINAVPQDPKAIGKICSNGDEWRGYAYKTNEDGSKYFLVTALELEPLEEGRCPFTWGSEYFRWCNCSLDGMYGNLYFTTAD